MCPGTFTFLVITQRVHLQQVLKMTSMRFNARLHTSHHGPTHPLKDDWVFVDGLTGVHDGNGEVSLCGQQELQTQGFSDVPTGHNPKHSNLVGV
jgi:hypothetical protein